MTKVLLNNENKSQVRLALFAFFFLTGLCFSSWASRIPEIKALFGFDDAAWGTMLLMIPIGQVVGMTFSGRLIARVGSNKVLYAAITGYALTLMAIGLAPSKGVLVASLIIYGFFGNFCNIAMNSQALLIEGHYSKPVMASFHGGWSLAGLCGGVVGLLMNVVKVPTYLHFITVGAIILVVAALLYRFLQYDAAPRSVVAEVEGSKKKRVPYEMFLVWFGVIGFFGWTTEGTMSDWNGIYLKDIVGVEESLTPIGLTVYMITMTIGRFVMDRATAAWGRKRLLCFCGVAISSGMFIAVLMPSFVMTIFGFMVVGLGACGVIPLLYSATGEKSAMHSSRAITFVSSISFAGFLIGPPIIGYISELTSLRHAFALVGVFGLLGSFISWRLKELD